jgi:hypothetical protein
LACWPSTWSRRGESVLGDWLADVLREAAAPTWG